MDEVVILSDEVAASVETLRRLRQQRGEVFDASEYLNKQLATSVCEDVAAVYEDRAAAFLQEYRDRRLEEICEFFGEARIDAVVATQCLKSADRGEGRLAKMEYKRELLDALVEIQVGFERESWGDSIEYGSLLFTESGEGVGVVSEYSSCAEVSKPSHDVRQGVSALTGRVLESFTGGESSEFRTGFAFVALNTDAVFIDEQQLRQYSPWDML